MEHTAWHSRNWHYYVPELFCFAQWFIPAKLPHENAGAKQNSPNRI